MNPLSSERAVVLLAAYDAQALFLTLESLTKTLSESETIVIILNGKTGIRSGQVEQLARDWSKNNKNRHVVRPLNYGNDPYNSIKEVIDSFEPLKNIKYICKIDDDLIPLKKGWLDDLHKSYLEEQNVGFVTSLINNNAWGFAELINIFDKKDEYSQIMNYKSASGEGQVEAHHVANGLCGTVWQYPYVSKWCHQWTLLDIENYISKTLNLENKEISLETHYSIGCIFFKKELWKELETINKTVNFDELSLHLYCKENKLKKIAVMRQPMGHLFYFIQRKQNAHLLPLFAESLANYWQDKIFFDGPRFSTEEFISMQFEEMSMSSVNQNLKNKGSFVKVLKKLRDTLR